MTDDEQSIHAAEIIRAQTRQMIFAIKALDIPAAVFATIFLKYAILAFYDVFRTSKMTDREIAHLMVYTAKHVRNKKRKTEND